MPVPGILIKYTPGDVETNEELKREGVKVDFYVTSGDPSSKNFVTNSRIRKAINSAGLMQEKPFKIGGMTFSYGAKAATLVWEDYYPFVRAGGEKSVFAGKGIASLLEYNVLVKAKEFFPKVKRVSHIAPSDSRARQLRKRGIWVWEFLGREFLGLRSASYSYEKALSVIRKKIAREAMARVNAVKPRQGFRAVKRGLRRLRPV